MRRGLIRTFPRWTLQALAARSRRQSHRLLRSWGSTELNAKLIAAFGPVVRSGPFAGLRLPEITWAEHLGPYLLGCYEQELQPWLRELRALPIRKVVDVGAKFGYYAVGFARWFVARPVIAIDTDPWARRSLKAMARENRVENLGILGYTSAKGLADIVVPGTLVFSDCEGFEDELFCAAMASSFRESWLVIETHDWAAPGVEKRLRERFAATHLVRAVEAEPREPPGELREILTAEQMVKAVNELRGESQRWLYFYPRALASRAMLEEGWEQPE